MASTVERDSEEFEKARKENLTFYDLHNLRRAPYRAYLPVLEAEEVLHRVCLCVYESLVRFLSSKIL
jgi:hypothetical protein